MKFLHVGMKVDDIERSRALYGQLFGMSWEPVSEYALGDAVLEGEVVASRTLVSHGWSARRHRNRDGAGRRGANRGPSRAR